MQVIADPATADYTSDSWSYYKRLSPQDSVCGILPVPPILQRNDAENQGLSAENVLQSILLHLQRPVDLLLPGYSLHLVS